MQEGVYLIVDPACEVNESGTRDKNDGNEVVDNCDLPLDLELTERVEVDDETLPYAKEDWDSPEQTEIDKERQPDLLFTMETRQSKKGRNKKKYNPYGENFVIDRIVLSDMKTSMVIFVWGGGIGLTHTKNLIIKKLKSARGNRRTGNRRRER